MIAALVLAALIVIVPHGDDENTVMPEILAADDVTVVVMTDGAATSRCGNVGYQACEAKRHASTVGFLNDIAPDAKLVWLGWPDGKLSSSAVRLAVGNICPYCDVLAAGADYGHPDHDAVRDGVESVSGWAYDGTLRERDSAFTAMRQWYGWLVKPDQYQILGYR